MCIGCNGTTPTPSTLPVTVVPPKLPGGAVSPGGTVLPLVASQRVTLSSSGMGNTKTGEGGYSNDQRHAHPLGSSSISGGAQ